MAYVLVVDDEPAVRQLLTRWLEGWGCQVKHAATATQALELMESEAASIVLCDVKMPGHDGLWLVEQVRPRWPKTVFIMATGAHDFQTVRKSRQNGAVDYLTKPFGRELVRQALQRASVALEQ